MRCSPGSSSTRRRYAQLVSTPLALIHAQETSLDTVINVLGCERTKARALLIHYQWDTEHLMGTWSTYNVPICKLAYRRRCRPLARGGVSTGPHRRPCRNAPTIRYVTACTSSVPLCTTTSLGNLHCETCFSDVPVSDATRMDCGHAFCNDCWLQHFRVQITDGNSRRLACMAVRCGNLCNEDKVAALLSRPASKPLLDRYTTSIAESYVEDNRRVKWCPSVPHCGAAVRVNGEPYVEPTCACGTRFCFHCTLEPHSPCTCDM